MRQLRVLAGCEMRGRVRDEFAKRNWEAWSADILPSEVPAHITVTDHDRAVTDITAPANTHHYQGDVRDLFDPGHPVNTDRYIDGQCNYIAPDTPLWDLFIGFPPCDHLSLAGARYWKQKRADGRQQAAADFFMEMVYAPARYVAVENPRGDMKRRYRPPDQVVEPFMFGDPYAKKTCLWLRGGLPLLVPDDLVEPTGRVATGGGSHRTDKAAGRKAMNGYEDSETRANRKKVRSRTMPGLARALASQWGRFIEEGGHDAREGEAA